MEIKMQVSPDEVNKYTWGEIKESNYWGYIKYAGKPFKRQPVVKTGNTVFFVALQGRDYIQVSYWRDYMIVTYSKYIKDLVGSIDVKLGDIKLFTNEEELKLAKALFGEV